MSSCLNEHLVPIITVFVEGRIHICCHKHIMDILSKKNLASWKKIFCNWVCSMDIYSFCEFCYFVLYIVAFMQNVHGSKWALCADVPLRNFSLTHWSSEIYIFFTRGSIMLFAWSQMTLSQKLDLPRWSNIWADCFTFRACPRVENWVNELAGLAEFDAKVAETFLCDFSRRYLSCRRWSRTSWISWK